MIKYNKETKQLEIRDNYKGRLKSSRIMSVIILILGIVKLFLADWNKPREMDYVFCLIVALFVYLVYKNLFVNTAIDTIDKYNIKYVKMPKALATKATIKLNNGKSRDVFGLKQVSDRETFRKLLTDAKIRVI
ncbi:MULTISPECIES: hypothetical protein [Myroides]|uniref:Uncharacterized protein n=1 Tax=Myroides albus TaxID=2562892 RepID=A0A6I3LQT0_9FLAO|nr:MULTISPECIES: hypothetical protein [Myroides]MTG98522.1 hypothetical protein [Myroides albus]MVX34935.1 hypothetical protein [Myroides sp. LoEW2-1]UVD79544.1 hypothetical protein NWE55_15685 [Myroides albus]